MALLKVLPWVSSITNTWQFVGNANFWAPPQTCWVKDLGDGPSHGCFNRFPSVPIALSLRSSSLRNGSAKERKLKEVELQVRKNLQRESWTTVMGGYNIADFDAWFRKYLLTPMCVQGPLLNLRKGSVKEGVSLLFWSYCLLCMRNGHFSSMWWGNGEISVRLTGQMWSHQWASSWTESSKMGRYYLEKEFGRLEAIQRQKGMKTEGEGEREELLHVVARCLATWGLRKKLALCFVWRNRMYSVPIGTFWNADVQPLSALSKN